MGNAQLAGMTVLVGAALTGTILAAVYMRLPQSEQEVNYDRCGLCKKPIESFHELGDCPEHKFHKECWRSLRAMGSRKCPMCP